MLWTLVFGLLLMPLGMMVALVVLAFSLVCSVGGRRQQYCPECGRAAPVMGCDTRCDQCGCLYDRHGNHITARPVHLN